MAEFIPWNSQPIQQWTAKHAKGTVIELDGHKTHYIEKGQGETLILIHGFVYDTNLWEKNIDVLAQQYHVYAIDLWGFGFSTKQILDFGYGLYAKQLKLFMDHLGLDQAHLAGQSMGGGTIIEFTVNNPERVNKLILVNCAGMPNPIPLMGRFFNLPKVGEFFLGLKTNFIRRNVLQDLFFYDNSLVTQQYAEKVLLHHKIEGATAAMLKVQRGDFFDKLLEQINKLGQMNKAILIVWGKQDKALPIERGEKMHQILTGSRFEVLDHAGHVSNDEQAAKFNQLALEFLQE
jgi:pimeloyl-ACP methyl ester carboxylesterase